MELITKKDHGKKHGINSKIMWGWKKSEANKEDFSLIRIMFGINFGDKLVRLLKVLNPIGIFVGIILMIVGTILDKNSVIILIGLLFFILGLGCIALLIVLSVIGQIYNWIRNIIEELINIFRK
ncbi:MAG: hypothetical protein V1740_03080 [Candidatus Woesearchaeota archaeon]